MIALIVFLVSQMYIQPNPDFFDYFKQLFMPLPKDRRHLPFAYSFLQLYEPCTFGFPG